MFRLSIPWLSFYFVLLFHSLLKTSNTSEIRKSSQCFKSHGIPRVTLECPPPEMILIVRAFHGIGLSDRRLLPPPTAGAGGTRSGGHHPRPATQDTATRCYSGPGYDPVNCTYCPGDCIDDSMNPVYDWSTCLGFGSCSRTVMQSHMPACPGRDKFSDYLQVEYQCISKTHVFDICEETPPRLIRDGYVTSPGYPDPYLSSQDCLCRMVADREDAKVTIVFYDLTLETKQGRCKADWLMLRQNAERHRHCGAMVYGTRNVTSSSNSIDIQFHSDGNDVRVQNFNYYTRKLKGFWVFVRADRGAKVLVSCRRLDRDDPTVKEFESEDSEVDDEEIGKTGVEPLDHQPNPEADGEGSSNYTSELALLMNNTSSGSRIGAKSTPMSSEDIGRLIALFVINIVKVVCY